jgi:hypothetical protein
MTELGRQWRAVRRGCRGAPGVVAWAAGAGAAAALLVVGLVAVVVEAADASGWAVVLLVASWAGSVGWIAAAHVGRRLPTPGPP